MVFQEEETPVHQGRPRERPTPPPSKAQTAISIDVSDTSEVNKKIRKVTTHKKGHFLLISIKGLTEKNLLN